ncbi:MAG: glycosyltransferase family 2 protein [Actinobacteria bacterium]|nr:glycosyltransferase family 2 protein [Actinomycetota bacterium]
MDLSFIIVNYKSSRLLRHCLDSIKGSNLDISYEVIVVDNNSADSGLKELQLDHQDVVFMELPENRGFAAGNNAGIIASSGEVIALVNPDVVLGAGAIQILYEKLSAQKDLGIVGPKIFYADHRLQTEVLPKKLPTLSRLAAEMFYFGKLFPHNAALNSYYGGGLDYDKEQEMEQVSGACLMIKKDVVNRIGLMDEGYFLYFEETDWCLRCARAGYKILYVPEATIVHHEGGSSSGNKKVSIQNYYRSQLRFFRKNYGIADVLFLYMLNVAGFAFRLLTAPVFLFWHREKSNSGRSFWALMYHLKPANLIQSVRL